MFMIAPPFWGGVAGPPPPDPGTITIGSVTVAPFSTLNMVAAQVDSTRVVVFFQNLADNKASAVVVADAGGGAVSWKTVVPVSSGVGSVLLLGMEVLDAGAGTYMGFYSASNVIYSRIFSVSGDVVTVTGTEDIVADTSTIIGSTSLAPYRGCVMGVSSAACVFANNANVYAARFGSISGGTTTWGGTTLLDATINTPMGQGSRLLPTGAGSVVMFANKAFDNTLYVTEISSGSASALFTPVVAADRVLYNLASSTPGAMARLGATLYALMCRTDPGAGIYCTRAVVSSGVSSFSNNNVTPNLLSAGPYVIPPETTGMMVAAPSMSSLLHISRSGTTWWGGIMGVSGNINMAGDTIALTPSGASSAVPGAAFLGGGKFIMVWSASGVMRGQVCALS